MKSIAADMIVAALPYLAIVLFLLAGPKWTSRSRMPGNWIGRIQPVRSLTATRARRRADRVRSLLLADGVAESDQPACDPLAAMLAARTYSLIAIVALWTPPLLLSVISLELLTVAGHANNVGLLICWAVLALTLVLAEVDRQVTIRSVPLEWTVHTAVFALEAYNNQGPAHRGDALASVVSEAVDDFCAALERQANLAPRRADHVLRRRIRNAAHLIVRNTQAAKVRLLSGENAARTDLAKIIASVLRHAVQPTNQLSTTVVLADEQLLDQDPNWQRDAAPASTRAQIAAHLALAVLLAGAGAAMTLANLPDAAIAVIVPTLTTAGAVALRTLRIPTTLTPTPAANDTTTPGNAANEPIATGAGTTTRD